LIPLRESKQIGVYVAWLYIHFPLIIGFTAFGVSVELVVLSNQALALPSSEKWLLCASTFLCFVCTRSNTNDIGNDCKSCFIIIIIG
jgi:hypothetical protein